MKHAQLSAYSMKIGGNSKKKDFVKFVANKNELVEIWSPREKQNAIF